MGVTLTGDPYPPSSLRLSPSRPSRPVVLDDSVHGERFSSLPFSMRGKVYVLPYFSGMRHGRVNVRCR